MKEDINSLLIGTKLQCISTGLEKIANNQPIKKAEKQNFEWGTKLLGQIDWDSKHYKKHPDFTIIATELRPRFYKTFKIENLKRIYRTLKSFGKDVPLSKEELKQTYEGFALISENILTFPHLMGQI